MTLKKEGPVKVLKILSVVFGVVLFLFLYGMLIATAFSHSQEMFLVSIALKILATLVFPTTVFVMWDGWIKKFESASWAITWRSLLVLLDNVRIRHFGRQGGPGMDLLLFFEDLWERWTPSGILQIAWMVPLALTGVPVLIMLNILAIGILCILILDVLRIIAILAVNVLIDLAPPPYILIVIVSSLTLTLFLYGYHLPGVLLVVFSFLAIFLVVRHQNRFEKVRRGDEPFLPW